MNRRPFARLLSAPGAPWAALLFAAVLGGAAPSAAAQAVEIGNCAGGPPLRVGADDPRALLDEAERDALLVEMRRRFPILERDGFSAAVILMWRKAPNQWLFVSLKPNAFTRDGTLCFTATFVASVFEMTPALTKKYF